MTVKEMREWLKGKNDKGVIYGLLDVVPFTRELHLSDLVVKTDLKDLKKYEEIEDDSNSDDVEYPSIYTMGGDKSQFASELSIIRSAKKICKVKLGRSWTDDHLHCCNMIVTFDTGTVKMSIWWVNPIWLALVECDGKKAEKHRRELLEDIIQRLDDCEDEDTLR